MSTKTEQNFYNKAVNIPILVVQFNSQCIVGFWPIGTMAFGAGGR